MKKKKLLVVALLLLLSISVLFALSSCGEPGPQGPQGENGKDGVSPVITISDDGYWVINGEKTNVKADASSGVENPSELEFFPLDDGTYMVSVGNAKYLSNIVIPSTYKGKAVSKIGDDAFYNCTSLKSITIPDSVTSIGKRAFYGCTSLKSINVDSDNTCYKSIDGNLYSKDGKALVKYAIGKTATGFIVPDSVTSIGDSAFYGCKGLTSVTIPDSVTSISYDAFEDCNKLVEVINHSTFSIVAGNTDNGYVGCYALIVHNGESKIVNQNDYLFYTHNGTNYLLGYVGSDTELTLPESYNGQSYEIYKYAFYDCDSLTSVTIPDSVTSIGGVAFFSCSSLTSVTIGNSVTSIGDYAFYNCYSLTSVTIGNGVTSIGDSAFRECTSLTSITIPDSVTSIGYYAFSGCNSLTSITIPDSVTSIGDYAFYKCTILTIYCEAESKPYGWDSYWNYSNCPVVWGYKGTE